MTIRCHISLILSAFALACSSAGSEPDVLDVLSSSLSQPAYVDVRDYVRQPEDSDRWYAITFALKQDFDAICGDTFCEGDYGNYESLGFRCSVEQHSGTLGRCMWTFAASIDEVVAATGDVKIEARIWRCPMPVIEDMPLVDLLTALTAVDESPLYSPLPGSGRSFYDGLLECL